MKKLFLGILLVGAILCINGCKSNENTSGEVNPYPLTNDLQNVDGTLVKPPTW